MPIVFVHGVNNRLGDDYRDNQAGRDGFLREIVAPALGLNAKEVFIDNPYWGDHGAQFLWNMAVLPDFEETYEKFGAEGDVEAFGRTVELVAKSPPFAGGIADRARSDFAEAVDLLYGATLAGVATEEESVEVAQSYSLAVDYVASNPRPDWLDKVTDANFADLLTYELKKASADGEESMGGGQGGLLDQLKEGLSRLVQAIPDAGTELLNRLARKKLNTTVTRFAGDAFVYLAKRGVV